MTYELAIRCKAQKQLADLLARDYKNGKEVILNLAKDPRPACSIKLIGRNGWRIRQGDLTGLFMKLKINN